MPLLNDAHLHPTLLSSHYFFLVIRKSFTISYSKLFLMNRAVASRTNAYKEFRKFYQTDKRRFKTVENVKVPGYICHVRRNDEHLLLCL